MGLGVLGERVARSVAQFDFPVNGWSRSGKSIDGVRVFCGASQLHGFLAATRVLVCLLPLTPDTRDIMDHEMLSLLRRSLARLLHLLLPRLPCRRRRLPLHLATVPNSAFQ